MYLETLASYLKLHGGRGFKSKGGETDFWMRLDPQKDGSLVYEYVLLCTDAFLVVSENEESILK